jgi:uncharacterized protein (DUF934 family)
MKFIDKAHDPWRHAAGEDGPTPHPLPLPHQLLTLEQWHAVRQAWPAHLPTGVLFPNDADIETLEADLPRLSLVVLQFPKWVDGRAYSQARLLRSRLRFTGEVRAVGDVVVDMAPLLKRTGFDSVVLRGDQKREHAERALDFFAGHYQGDVKQPRPLFARAPEERTQPAPFLQEGASI